MKNGPWLLATSLWLESGRLMVRNERNENNEENEYSYRPPAVSQSLTPDPFFLFLP